MKSDLTDTDMKIQKNIMDISNVEKDRRKRITSHIKK